MERRTASLLAVSAVLLGAVSLARCSFGVNPDSGHFSCATTSDCASGQQCVPQAFGANGLCYPQGPCQPDYCGPGAACGDGGCIDCTECASPACAGGSCVLDGGAQQCVIRLVLPDGGLVDAGPADAGVDAGLDAGVTTTYVCDFP